MSAETLHTFARVRSLALAAMIEVGGKPCWVAAYDTSAPPIRLAVPVAVAPRPGRPDLNEAPRVPPPRSTASRRSAATGSELRPDELAALAFADTTLLAAITRALNRLGTTPPASPRRALAPGAHSLARRV